MRCCNSSNRSTCQCTLRLTSSILSAWFDFTAQGSLSLNRFWQAFTNQAKHSSKSGSGIWVKCHLQRRGLFVLSMTLEAQNFADGFCNTERALSVTLP